MAYKHFVGAGPSRKTLLVFGTWYHTARGHEKAQGVHRSVVKNKTQVGFWYLVPA